MLGSLHRPGNQLSSGEHHPGVQQPCVAEEHWLPQGSAWTKQGLGDARRKKQGGGRAASLPLFPQSALLLTAGGACAG